MLDALSASYLHKQTNECYGQSRKGGMCKLIAVEGSECLAEDGRVKPRKGRWLEAGDVNFITSYHKSFEVYKFRRYSRNLGSSETTALSRYARSRRSRFAVSPSSLRKMPFPWQSAKLTRSLLRTETLDILTAWRRPGLRQETMASRISSQSRSMARPSRKKPCVSSLSIAVDLNSYANSTSPARRHDRRNSSKLRQRQWSSERAKMTRDTERLSTSAE